VKGAPDSEMHRMNAASDTKYLTSTSVVEAVAFPTNRSFPEEHFS